MASAPTSVLCESQFTTGKSETCVTLEQEAQGVALQYLCFSLQK